MKGSKSVSATFREDPMEVCKIFHEINHATNECASLSSFLHVPKEQVHAFNSYWPIILHILTIIIQIYETIHI